MAVRDFIPIDQLAAGASQATELVRLKNALQEAYSQGLKVRGIMEHNHDNVNFGDLEQLFGIPAGKGQIVFDLVNGAIGSMEGLFQVDDCKELCERIG